MPTLLLFMAQAADSISFSGIFTGGSLIAAATACVAVGAMRERVNGIARTLSRHSSELEKRLTKDEFSLLCEKVDALHEDVREIRKRVA